MILNFLSPCWQFKVKALIAQVERPPGLHLLGSSLQVIVPIDSKPNDMMLVDLGDGNVPLVYDLEKLGTEAEAKRV